jgi:hypothetical protein
MSGARGANGGRPARALLVPCSSTPLAVHAMHAMDAAHAPSSPTRADAVSETVVRHASNALMGGSAVVKACTREAGGTLNLRLRTNAVDAASACEEDRTARMRRALGLVERELKQHLPLARCTIQRSAVDGLDEVEVSVPGRCEAWRRARAEGAAGAVPTFMRVVTALLVAAAIGLVALPFVR